jgi:WD40 repeat protein
VGVLVGNPHNYLVNYVITVCKIHYRKTTVSSVIFPVIESQGDITIWDLTEWTQRRKIYEKGNEIQTMDFSHDGKIFATAGKVKIMLKPVTDEQVFYDKFLCDKFYLPSARVYMQQILYDKFSYDK